MNQMPRSCSPSMSRSCMQEQMRTCPPKYEKDMLDTMNCCQLLQHINEVSFAVDDILLYLDTHPCDADALAYARKMIGKRRKAMDIYAKKYGPLTIDCTNERESSNWDWVMQPWPWEPKQKGGCK